MSAAVVSDAPAVQPPKDKKSKRERTKKRDREPGAEDAAEPKSKKAKQQQQQKATEVEGDDSTAIAANGSSTTTTTEKPEKKKKQRHRNKSDAATEVVAAAAEPVAATEEAVEPEDDAAPAPEEKKKKEKKSKKSKKETVEPQPEPEAEVETQPTATASSEEPKKRRKRDRKSKDHDAIVAAATEDQSATAAAPAVAEDPDAMEIDSTPVKKTTKKSSKSKTSTTSTTTTTTTAAAAKSSLPTSSTEGHTYPFFTQTVSLYLPLFPQGMTEPLEGYADQHLKLLLNRYVPDLKGILLAYRNPRLGERPGAKSLTEQSTQEDVALLESIAEYAVAYGWFTAEVDIFRPSRGAWMEGTINLQSEGFVGVICFDMFNASIEKARLPEGWKWVDTMSSAPAVKKSAGAAAGAVKKGKHITFGDSDEDEENAEEQEENAEEEEEEKEGAEEEIIADSTEQLHQTGYWADATGARVTGKLPFRIKNYEVGSSETHGYLSIEGTMLSEEDELAKVLDEREEARRRRKRLMSSGYLPANIARRIPDFATTKFAVAPIEEEEDEMQRAEKWKKGGSAVEGED